MNTVGLGDRMKQYEAIHDTYIDKSHYYIVRLDGCNFSTYCRPLHKPFDINFIKALSLTQKDLMLKFNALTSYSHSDEISLLFDKTYDHRQKHYEGGRIQKIVSQMAAYCSIRFNHHMNVICIDCEYRNHIMSNEAFFDARIMSFVDQYEAVNCLLWRSVFDCERNAISTYAQQYYTVKELHDKSTKSRIIMLHDQGLDWSIIPTYIKHGIYCKRYPDNRLTNINGKEMMIMRASFRFKNFKIVCDDDNIKAMFKQSWIDSIYDDEKYDINHLLL
jgi:tRNA(His) 5'-end guanylyltransferase